MLKFFIYFKVEKLSKHKNKRLTLVEPFIFMLAKRLVSASTSKGEVFAV